MAFCIVSSMDLQCLPKEAIAFMCLQYKSFGNNVGKDIFLLFPQCFVSFWRTSCNFHHIQNCCLQTISFRKSLKFAVWKELTLYKMIKVVDLSRMTKIVGT